MKGLQAILGLYVCLCIIGAVLLLRYLGGTKGVVIAGYILVNASVVTAGLLFERGRYKPTVSTDKEGWQRTGERFIDTTSGKTMEVRYNPKTGERDYIEVEN